MWGEELRKRENWSGKGKLLTVKFKCSI
jgi:hypothetical protein